MFAGGTIWVLTHGQHALLRGASFCGIFWLKRRFDRRSPWPGAMVSHAQPMFDVSGEPVAMGSDGMGSDLLVGWFEKPKRKAEALGG